MVASDRIKIPKEIVNLKKTVFLTAGIFFVIRILLFISLIRNIDFSGVSHLIGRTEAIIFDDFKDMVSSIYRKASVSRTYTRMVNS